MEGLEPRSVTKEEFEEKYSPLINTIAELVISHPDIPEEVEQSDLLGAITLLKTELSNQLNGRVPEFVKLQDELAKKNKQVTKLQETNQQLYLKVGSIPDPSKNPMNTEPQKKSYAEIKSMIENL